MDVMLYKKKKNFFAIYVEIPYTCNISAQEVKAEERWVWDFSTLHGMILSQPSPLK